MMPTENRIYISMKKLTFLQIMYIIKENFKS